MSGLKIDLHASEPLKYEGDHSPKCFLIVNTMDIKGISLLNFKRMKVKFFQKEALLS